MYYVCVVCNTITKCLLISFTEAKPSVSTTINSTGKQCDIVFYVRRIFHVMLVCLHICVLKDMRSIGVWLELVWRARPSLKSG